MQRDKNVQVAAGPMPTALRPCSFVLKLRREVGQNDDAFGSKRRTDHVPHLPPVAAAPMHDGDSAPACDVVIVGGSTSALAAAVTAAKEGAQACLLEPTDMPGGQMTSNGIPALDFSYENGCKPFNVSGAGIQSNYECYYYYSIHY